MNIRKRWRSSIASVYNRENRRKALSLRLTGLFSEKRAFIPADSAFFEKNRLSSRLTVLFLEKIGFQRSRQCFWEEKCTFGRPGSPFLGKIGFRGFRKCFFQKKCAFGAFFSIVDAVFVLSSHFTDKRFRKDERTGVG